MTESSLSGYFTASDFRIGHVLSRTASIFVRNALAYLAVTSVAALPLLLVSVLLPSSPASVGNPFQSLGSGFFTFFLTVVLEILGQAIVLYGAFQYMRGKPVRLADCVKVGLRRFFPLIRLAILVALAMLAYFLLLGVFVRLVPTLGLVQIEQSPVLVTLTVLAWFIPLVILFLMCFVATPACVVERRGAFRSLGRSRALTKGHRWKIFGLIYAILVAVTYHDLRVAKEGVDTEQIAAVFE
jgi:hypothetical protein